MSGKGNERPLLGGDGARREEEGKREGTGPGIYAFRERDREIVGVAPARSTLRLRPLRMRRRVKDVLADGRHRARSQAAPNQVRI